MEVDEIKFGPLLYRSLLAGAIAAAILFPFHYLMRIVASFPGLDHFSSFESAALFFLILFLKMSHEICLKANLYFKN